MGCAEGYEQIQLMITEILGQEVDISMKQKMKSVREKILRVPTERMLRGIMEPKCRFIVESPVESPEKDRAIITMPT